MNRSHILPPLSASWSFGEALPDCPKTQVNSSVSSLQPTSVHTHHSNLANAPIEIQNRRTMAAAANDGDDGNDVDSVSTGDPFFSSHHQQPTDGHGAAPDAADVYAYMTMGNDNTQGLSASSCEEELALAVEEELGRGRHRWADDLAALHDWEGKVRERAQELQLNHVTLQLQAVAAREAAVRAERDALAQRVAEVEQDQLLLEAKLRDVVTFESSDPNAATRLRPSRALMLTTVRGKLLEAATTRIGELSDALSDQVARAAHEAEAHARQLAETGADAAALREIAERLGEQLAHRTVLFAAQDRRFRESLRAQLSLQAEQGRDLAGLRARLQQLEGMYERTDRERIEGHLRGAALQEELTALHAQQADDRDRAAALADELAEAMRSNAALQATVERLRGADAVDMERELALEVEELRRAARDSESQLRRQLEAARARVAQESEARALLFEELQRLRAVVDADAGGDDDRHHRALQQSSLLAEEGSREEVKKGGLSIKPLWQEQKMRSRLKMQVVEREAPTAPKKSREELNELYSKLGKVIPV